MNGRSRTVLTIVIVGIMLAATVMVHVSAARVLAHQDAATETPMAEETANADGFVPDYQTSSSGTVNFRSEPSSDGGEATVIAVLPLETPLQFLGETQPSDNPTDDGEDGWMFFRIEDGTEGWLRAIDVERYEANRPTEAVLVGTPDSQVQTVDDLARLLPDQDLVPEGLTGVADSTRTLDQIVEALGGSRTAETNLDAWGWFGNVERSFSPVDPTAFDPAATNTISVSIHGFGSATGAAEALTFFSDILVDANGYAEADPPDLGDSARLLTMTDADGQTLVALYVQDGPILYRIAGSSTAGDPATDVIDLAGRLLEANGDVTITVDVEPTSAANTDATEEGGGETTGALVVVVEDGVNLRAEPTTEGEVVRELDAGEVLELQGEPVEADGYLWYEVIVTDTGEMGWVTADFLEPAE